MTNKFDEKVDDYRQKAVKIFNLYTQMNTFWLVSWQRNCFD